MRKELAWLRRGPPARTSKPKFRIDAANALIADEPPPRNSVELASFASRRLGKDVLDLEDVDRRARRAADERLLLDHVTWRLAPGRAGRHRRRQRRRQVDAAARAHRRAARWRAGRRKIGKTVAIAHLTQEVRELERFEQWRVIEAIEDVEQWTTLGGKEISASQLATRLGFPGGRQQARVGDLCGGERRRLQLTRLLLTEPNVLILDEPTNDLDIETLTSLEDVLDGWAGTLVVVSHDRYLLERVCRPAARPARRRQGARAARAASRSTSGCARRTSRPRSRARPRPRPRAVARLPHRARLDGTPAQAAATASPAEVREARKVDGAHREAALAVAGA